MIHHYRPSESGEYFIKAKEQKKRKKQLKAEKVQAHEVHKLTIFLARGSERREKQKESGIIPSTERKRNQEGRLERRSPKEEEENGKTFSRH